MAEARYAHGTHTRRMGGVAGPLTFGILAACSPQQTPQRDTRIEVIAGEAPSPDPGPAASHAVHHPTPSPTANHAPALVVHKTFTDPPLPPELREDGGLTPLPPRPTAAAMASDMRLPAAGATSISKGDDRP